MGRQVRRVLRHRSAPRDGRPLRDPGHARLDRPLAEQPSRLAGGGGRRRRRRSRSACWAALSAIWSPAPEIAIEDAQRILAYAVAFGLGLWLSDLLGPRAHLALVPLALAGAFAGVIAVVGMHGGDHPAHYLDNDGTLEFPLGYRNANAAFFLIALWPALGLAARRGGIWIGRAAALGRRHPLPVHGDAQPEPGVDDRRGGGPVRVRGLLA